MSLNGFRFVHATSLMLDEPLVGTGPLTGEDRLLAEESTFQTWGMFLSFRYRCIRWLTRMSPSLFPHER